MSLGWDEGQVRDRVGRSAMRRVRSELCGRKDADEVGLAGAWWPGHEASMVGTHEIGLIDASILFAARV